MPTPTAHIRACLQRVATGPEMSKPLTREDAREAMRLILERQIDPVQAGIYLIALRMKRETDDENLGTLDALLAAGAREAVDCDTLVDIAEPFNGFVRSLPAAPFLPPVLAACGLGAYSHGVRAAPPKYGVTHHLVYAAAGIAVDLSPREAAGRVAERGIGWAYVDQSRYLPGLHELLELRALMVKRCCLSTLEVVLGPLRGRRTHLLTGYVHKAYPAVYQRLARAAGYDAAMIVRGVEGGGVPSLSQVSRFFGYGGGGDGGGGDDGDTSKPIRLNPSDVGITQPDRAIPIPPHLQVETPADSRHPAAADVTVAIDACQAAAHCAELGARVLAGDAAGDAGAMRDSLIYAGAICLLHCARAADLPAAAAQIRRVLDSGAALARFTAGRG